MAATITSLISLVSEGANSSLRHLTDTMCPSSKRHIECAFGGRVDVAKHAAGHAVDVELNDPTMDDQGKTALQIVWAAPQDVRLDIRHV